MRHVVLLVVKFPNFLYAIAIAIAVALHISNEGMFSSNSTLYAYILNYREYRGNYLLMHDMHVTWYQYFQYPFLDSSSEKD